MIQFGRYENLEEVGRGGFSVVYKAHDPKLNRAIALKVLHAGYGSDPNFVERFHQEAQTVASLNHPNIVTIYDFGEEDRQLFIAMEFLAGGDLQKWLNQKGEPLTVEEAITFLEPIASALDYAHKQGVVHRDIKPSNMMLQQTGDDRRIVLTDFGLVKAMEDSVALTMTNQMLGSPEYMAPEQADITRRDEIGPATDLYAFGIVTYQMLAGRVPFPGHTLSVLNAHVNIPPPSPIELNDRLSPEIAGILLKMLSKAPADRYLTAAAFVAALQVTVHTVAQSQQREAQIAPMYANLLAAKEAGNWLEVMTLAAQIEILSPDYKDVSTLQTEARAALQTPNLQPSPPPEIEEQTTPSPSEGAGWGEGEPQPTTDTQPALFTGIKIPVSPTEEVARDESEQQPTTDPLPSPPPERERGQTTASASQGEGIPPWLKWGGIALALLIVLGGGYAIFGGGGNNTDNPPAVEDANMPPQHAALGDTWERPVDGMTMVFVPGGTFSMGSDDGGDNEQPIHYVTLDAFWIDRTEVTNDQFAQFVADINYETTAEGEGNGWVFTGSEWKVVQGADWQHPTGPNSTIDRLSKYPVVLVSWQDAKAYCKWAGGRLPTEAEWEYAARGEYSSTYPWGDEFDGENLNFCDANCPAEDWKDDTVDDGYEFTAPVHSYPGGDSWVGAADMAGNVWEWVNDWYDSDYYVNFPSDKSASLSSGEFKVLRGGSWGDNASNTRSSDRFSNSPSARGDSFGVRCAAPGM